ncbi:MAG: RnfH family protein [Rhodoferax sp.]
MAADRVLQVCVVYSPAAREVHEVNVSLQPGSTVLHSLQASGLLQRFPALDQAGILVGIWGRKSDLQQTLRQHDRVEIYRALRVDPKVARRERFAKQGARGAGLFSTRRGDAKAGG